MWVLIVSTPLKHSPINFLMASPYLLGVSFATCKARNGWSFSGTVVPPDSSTIAVKQSALAVESLFLPGFVSAPYFSKKS